MLENEFEYLNSRLSDPSLPAGIVDSMESGSTDSIAHIHLPDVNSARFSVADFCDER